jgi:hypothetical protein
MPTVNDIKRQRDFVHHDLDCELPILATISSVLRNSALNYLKALPMPVYLKNDARLTPNFSNHSRS